MEEKIGAGGFTETVNPSPPPLQLVIRERRNSRNYNTNEHSTNKCHSMGTQTRQKRNGDSNCKSTEKLWLLLLPLQGLRWGTTGTNVEGHSLSLLLLCSLQKLARGFLMKGPQKRKKEAELLD